MCDALSSDIEVKASQIVGAAPIAACSPAPFAIAVGDPGGETRVPAPITDG